MTEQRIIIIGAGYAGLLAAVRLAGKTRRVPVRITLVNASDVFVERMRLHQLAAGQPLRRRPILATLRGTGVQFVQGRVTHIDPARAEIVVQTASGLHSMPYDKLLYAPGSTIDRTTVPGVADHAYTLTPEGSRSAPALREALLGLKNTGGRVVIGGGGATGIEAAAEIADAYPNLEINLVTDGDLAMFLGRSAAAYIRKSLAKRGVVIRDHTTIASVEPARLVIARGESIPFDLCLWTGGFAVPDLARESGLAVNERGQVLIDPFMCSISHPSIYAAGDAAVPVEEPGVRVRMSAYTAAITGAHSADCLAAVVLGKKPKALSFAYAGQGIALGSGNAVGFGNGPDDTPHAPYFTGRAGYTIREVFVRLLAQLPNLERRIPGFFYWPGKGRYAAIKRRAVRGVQAKQRA